MPGVEAISSQFATAGGGFDHHYHQRLLVHHARDVADGHGLVADLGEAAFRARAVAVRTTVRRTPVSGKSSLAAAAVARYRRLRASGRDEERNPRWHDPRENS